MVIQVCFGNAVMKEIALASGAPGSEKKRGYRKLRTREREGKEIMQMIQNPERDNTHERKAPTSFNQKTFERILGTAEQKKGSITSE